MPPKKSAHRFALPIPPIRIPFSKDFVVFWTPDRALIELSFQRLLESANLSPQSCSLEARLMLQNSFDRVVRTGFATLHTFAQNSIDLFRREKPERIVARRIGPTICHRTKHRIEFARRTGCFGECSTTVNHGYFSVACFPRRRSAGIGRKALLVHIPAVSSPGSLFLCSEKQPVWEDQILSCIHGRVVNYPTCGRNNVQQEKEIRKGQWNYGVATRISITPGLVSSR